MRERKRHAVDMLLPVSLFLVLAASSLMVVVLCANLYRHNVEARDRNASDRLCLTYIMEKLHQNDKDAEVSLQVFDGLPAIVIDRDYGAGSQYVTCLYYDAEEGMLYELFASADAFGSLGRSSGQGILSAEGLTFESLGGNCLRIRCGGGDAPSETYVALRAVREGGVPDEG